MATLMHKMALSFNDVLLQPQYSDIESRLDTDLTTRLTNNISIKHPICSTNMDNVTDIEMMRTMAKSGSAGFLHRFNYYGNTLQTMRTLHGTISPLVVSVGVKEEDYELLGLLTEEHETRPDVILIDIAHGHSKRVIEMVKYIVENYSIDVIAGNVATKEAAMQLCDAGVNAIRVGIGGSMVCTTRTITGSGMPTLQSIIDCYEVTKKYNVPIIADGGFKNSGDIVKALAFGAESVSLGSLLAATSDSPGEIIRERVASYIGSVPQPMITTVEKKKFYGMASKDAQNMHNNGLKEGTAPEGRTILLPYQGETIDVLNELLGGIRSGLTYSGARNIQELRENAIYSILGAGGIAESKMI